MSPTTWANVASGAAMVIGAVWVIVALTRPLPAADVAGSAPIDPPARTPAPWASSDSSERATALAMLTAAGNIFAPDRAPWPERALADAGVEAPEDPAAPADAPPEPVAVAADPSQPPAYETIRVERTPPPAIDRELKQLHLRGVLRTGAGPAAVIQDAGDPATRGRALILRPGEPFRAGDWRVVAIDADQRRVILSRSGVNVELSLYDIPAGAAVVRRPPGPVAPLAPPGVVVRTRTPEQARADLIAAGLTEAEADEILRLAQETGATGAVAASPEPAAPALEGAPAVSDDMRALLEMMAKGVNPKSGGTKREPAPDAP